MKILPVAAMTLASTAAIIALVLTLLQLPRSETTTRIQTETRNASQNQATQPTLDEIFASGKGRVLIPAGTYEIDETIEVDLSETGTAVIQAIGGVTIVMNGSGPAIRLVGTLAGSADPNQITEENWLESFCRIEGIEIQGAHPEADGIELIRTLQPTLRAVKIRRARHAVMMRNRNRNVIVSDCHFYDNSGIGLFLDNVNLHQINVANSHLSYNREGGIVVRGGNVRNLHVTGCDLEANMPADSTATETANILIDSSAEDVSIAEVAITGCTIQHSAHYAQDKIAPGGVNIRILGRETYQPNMITITGNVMSDTHCHLHLLHVADVTVNGNTFFTTEPTDVLIEKSQRVLFANNVLNPREATGTGEVVLRNCEACLLTSNVAHELLASNAAICLEDSVACRIESWMISGSRNGVELKGCDNCVVANCSFLNLIEGGRPVMGSTEGNEIRGLNVQSTTAR